MDFTLAFAIVHESPDAGHFFGEVAGASKQNARVLLAGPRGHVGDEIFAAELRAAAAKGLAVTENPTIPRSLTAVLVKN